MSKRDFYVRAVCSYCTGDIEQILYDPSPEVLASFTKSQDDREPTMCEFCAKKSPKPKRGFVGGIISIDPVVVDSDGRPQERCNCGAPEGHVPGGIHCRA